MLPGRRRLTTVGDMTDIAPGFEPHFRKSPVTDPWEPLFSRKTDETVEIGFVFGPNHGNARGLLHGGVLAALCDNAMGLSLGRTLEAKGLSQGVGGIVTTRLTVDYLGAAKQGDWVGIAPRVVKAAKGSGVVDALITANGVLIARADALFRVLGG
jgi:uncharacterized protein (TIGR00369 family)